MSFTHDLLIRYAGVIVDRTDFEEVPLGWQALVTVLVRDIAETLAAHPGQTIAVDQIKEKFGQLRIYVRVGDGDAGEAIRAALAPIIAAATEKSAVTCQVCGMPVKERQGRSWSTLCDVHATRSSTRQQKQDDLGIGESDHLDNDTFGDPIESPDSRWTVVAEPVPQPSPRSGCHKLYRLRAVADALGRPADAPEDNLLSDKPETEHEARLGAILSLGENSTWRGLALPEPGMLTRLDALDAAAPHMTEVTALIRRHIKAALVVGLPIHLPPILMLGEAGTGKTWYLMRLGEVLGVPTRTYPMTAATLSEGLQGSHPSWRNATSGLVAKTLLQEPVSNPIILVDEIDKAGQGAWNQDPYRPFYSLLEPAGAKAFRDEYLGFEMDASAVMWMLAGNSLAPLPEPIQTRLTVVTIPALSRPYLAAVARSIYAEANARMRDFFDPELASATLDKLLGLTPRGIRLTLEDAMVRAAAEGRKEITAMDLIPRPESTVERIGFLAHRA